MLSSKLQERDRSRSRRKIFPTSKFLHKLVVKIKCCYGRNHFIFQMGCCCLSFFFFFLNAVNAHVCGSSKFYFSAFVLHFNGYVQRYWVIPILVMIICSGAFSFSSTATYFYEKKKKKN